MSARIDSRGAGQRWPLHTPAVIMPLENSQVRYSATTDGTCVRVSAEEQATNGTADLPSGLPPDSAGTTGFLYSVPSPTPTPTPPRTSLRLSPDATTGTEIDGADVQSAGLPGNWGRGFGGRLDFGGADEVGSADRFAEATGPLQRLVCSPHPPESQKVPTSRHSQGAGRPRQPPEQKKMLRPGLFTALLDNISLSQMPSQGTQEGVAELEDNCSRNCGARTGKTNHRMVSREGGVEPPHGTERVGEGKVSDRDVSAAAPTNGFLTLVSSKDGTATAVPKGDASTSGGIWSKCGVGLASSLALGSQEDFSLPDCLNNDSIGGNGDLHNSHPGGPGPLSVTPCHDGELVDPAERPETAQEHREASSPQTKAANNSSTGSAAVTSRLSSGTTNALASEIAAQSKIAAEPVHVGRASDSAEIRESRSTTLAVRVNGGGPAASLTVSGCRDQGLRPTPSAAERPGVVGGGREDNPACSSSSLHLSLTSTPTSQEKCANASALASRVTTPGKSTDHERLQPVSDSRAAQNWESTESDLSSLCLPSSPSQRLSNGPTKGTPEFQSPSGGDHGSGSNPEFICRFRTPRSVDRRSDHNSNSSSRWSLKLSNSLSTSPHRERSPRRPRQDETGPPDACIGSDAPAPDRNRESLQSTCEDKGAPAEPKPALSHSVTPPADTETSVGAGEIVDENSVNHTLAVSSSRDMEGNGLIAGGASDEKEAEAIVEQEGDELPEEQRTQEEVVGSDYDDGLETDCEEEALEEEENNTQIEEVDLHDSLARAVECSDPDDRRGADCDDKKDTGTQGSSTCLETVNDIVANAERALGQELVGVAGRTEGSGWVCEEIDGDETEVEDALPGVASPSVDGAGEIHTSIDAEGQITPVDTVCLGDGSAEGRATSGVVQANQHSATQSAQMRPAADRSIEEVLSPLEIPPPANSDCCNSNCGEQDNGNSATCPRIDGQASADREGRLSVPQGIMAASPATVQHVVTKPVASIRQGESPPAPQEAPPQLLGKGISERRSGSKVQATQRAANVSGTTNSGRCSPTDGVGGSHSCSPVGERCTSTDHRNNQRNVQSFESSTRPEPEYFKSDAAAKGRTNWGAAVYGREDAVSYAGVGGCPSTEPASCSNGDVVSGGGSMEAGRGGASCARLRDVLAASIDHRETDQAVGAPDVEGQGKAEALVEPPGAPVADLICAPVEELAQDVDVVIELPLKHSGTLAGCPAKSGTSTSEESGEVKLASLTPPRQTADKPKEVARSSSRPAVGGWLSSRRPTAQKHVPPTPPRESDTTSLGLADAETLSPEYFLASRAAAAKVEAGTRSGDVGAGAAGAAALATFGFRAAGAEANMQSKGPGIVESPIPPVANVGGSLKGTSVPVAGWLSKRLRKCEGETKDNKSCLENVGVLSAAKRVRKSRETKAMSCGDAIPGMSTPNRSPEIGDEIENTPPTSTKKKRLKARKLAGELTASMNQVGPETDQWEREDPSTTAGTAVGVLAVESTNEAMPEAVPNAAVARDTRQVGAVTDSRGAEAAAASAAEADKEDNRDMGCSLPPAKIVGKTQQDCRAEKAAPPSPCRAMLPDTEDVSVSDNKRSSAAQEPQRAVTKAGPLVCRTVLEEGGKGKRVRRVQRTCREDTLAREDVASRSAAEVRVKGGTRRAAANVDTSAQPAAGLSREQRASKLAAWNRWSVARKKYILLLIAKLDEARLEQNEANMETLAKELISAENEKFVYNPAERRDKTHGASLVSSEETTVRSTEQRGTHAHLPAAIATTSREDDPRTSKTTSSASTTRGKRRKNVAGTEEQRSYRRSHHVTAPAIELGDFPMSSGRQATTVPSTMVPSPSVAKSGKATTVCPGKRKAAARAEPRKRVGHGAGGTSPAPKVSERNAVAGSWREDADRRVGGGGSNVPVGRCNSDAGWISSRSRSAGIPTSGSADGAKKSMSRSKSVRVRSAKKLCSESTEACSRRTDAVPGCSNAQFSLNRAPEFAAGGRGKKRRVDLELGDGPSGTTRPPTKKKRGRIEKNAPPKDSASRRGRRSPALDGAAAADVSCSVNPPATSAMPQPAGEASRHQTPKDNKSREQEQQSRLRAMGYPGTTVDAGKTTEQATASPKGRIRRGQEMVRQAGAQSSSAVTKQHPSPAHQGLPRAVSSSANNRTFLGLRFVVTGFLDELKIRMLERAILEGGGLLQEGMTPPLSQPRRSRITGPSAGPSAAAAEFVIPAVSTRRGRGHPSDGHCDDVVVAVSHPSASREAGYVLALSTGTPLVHHLWISDSLAQGRARPAAPYLLPGVRETSKRRQVEAARMAAVISAPADASILRKHKTGGTGIRSRREGTDDSDAPVANAIVIARAAVAKVVAKPGTPLNGMSVGVAHACQNTCASWAKVLKSAGAQTVNEIVAPFPLDQGYDGDDGYDEIGAGSPAGNNRSRPVGCRGGENRVLGERLRSLLAGLDCVLCDYPGAWGDITPGTTMRRVPGVVDSGTSPAGLGRLWRKSTQQSFTLSSKTPTTYRNLSAGRRHGDNASAGKGFSFLHTLVKAAKLDGVPVVSLSWAAHCVIRGARIKWQSSPEYLAPFAQLMTSFTVNPRRGSNNGGISGRGGVFSSPVPFAGCNKATSILVFVSREGVRYEVNDHARFDDGIVGSTAAATGKNAGRNNSSIKRPPGSFSDTSKEGGSSGIGRIVSLSRAENGGVFVTLEPLQVSAAAVRTTSSGGGSSSRVLSAGVPVVVAGPSMDSSVSRGRTRRANQLTTVAGGSGSATCGRLKAGSACLRGRVTVLRAQEFDDRRGYCGRDPDVLSVQ